MSARKGTSHHGAKMTDKTVRAARRSYAARDSKQIVVDGKLATVSINSLARKYGVSHQTMFALIKGQTWKHVT